MAHSRPKDRATRHRTPALLLVALVTLLAASPSEAGLNTWTTGWPASEVNTAPGGTRSVAIDPQSPATVYAARQGGNVFTQGGVLKSTSGGQSWTSMNAGLEARNTLVVAVDPLTPATVYTGLCGGFQLSGGVWKSTDGAGSWTEVNAGLPLGQFGTCVQAIAIDPLTPTTLYAGPSDNGVFKSTNGGASWTAMNVGIPAGNGVLVFAIDPRNPLIVYAGMAPGPGGPGGLFKSTNGGASWAPKNVGIPATDTFVFDIAIDPQTPSTLYRSTSAGVFNANFSSHGLYKSTDGGETWVLASSGLPRPPSFSHVRPLAIDPLVPSTLYAGTTMNGVFRSTDGGASWAPMNDGLTTTSVGALAISPSGACLHASGGSGTGVFDFATREDACTGGPIPPPGPTMLVAAVLPSSRSVQVGTPATAFATILNAGLNQAVGVAISLASAIPATFAYQTTDCLTNVLVGTANTPASIPPGGRQCFVIAVTPTAPFGPTEVAFTFAGTNAPPVGVLVGINTLFLSGNASPTPDPIALAATLGNDGIVNIPGATGTGVFAVATSNVGITGTITVMADTGAAPLPVSIAICETNAAGLCTTPLQPSVSTTIPGLLSTGVAGTASYGIFVTGSGLVPFDPTANRIFVRLLDAGGVVRGSTSVAARTQ